MDNIQELLIAILPSLTAIGGVLFTAMKIFSQFKELIKKVDDKTDFVQEYFDAKKNEWNDEHDGLSIYGFPVELYVEDVTAKTTSGGL